MNRRSFLSTLAQAAAAFTILPSAVTYERTWKKSGELYTCEIIDPYPPGPHMLHSTMWQFTYDLATGAYDTKIVSEYPQRTVMSYEDFTKLRRGKRLSL